MWRPGSKRSRPARSCSASARCSGPPMPGQALARPRARRRPLGGVRPLLEQRDAARVSSGSGQRRPRHGSEVPGRSLRGCAGGFGHGGVSDRRTSLPIWRGHPTRHLDPRPGLRRRQGLHGVLHPSDERSDEGHVAIPDRLVGGACVALLLRATAPPARPAPQPAPPAAKGAQPSPQPARPAPQPTRPAARPSRHAGWIQIFDCSSADEMKRGESLRAWRSGEPEGATWNWYGSDSSAASSWTPIATAKAARS